MDELQMIVNVRLSHSEVARLRPMYSGGILR